MVGEGPEGGWLEDVGSGGALDLVIVNGRWPRFGEHRADFKQTNTARLPLCHPPMPLGKLAKIATPSPPNTSSGLPPLRSLRSLRSLLRALCDLCGQRLPGPVQQCPLEIRWKSELVYPVLPALYRPTNVLSWMAKFTRDTVPLTLGSSRYHDC